MPKKFQINKYSDRSFKCILAWYTKYVLFGIMQHYNYLLYTSFFSPKQVELVGWTL